jgi:hypothetical protein
VHTHTHTHTRTHAHTHTRTHMHTHTHTHKHKHMHTHAHAHAHAQAHTHTHTEGGEEKTENTTHTHIHTHTHTQRERQGGVERAGRERGREGQKSKDSAPCWQKGEGEPERVISSPAQLEGLPKRALARRKARLSMGPEGGTPTCHSLVLPG